MRSNKLRVTKMANIDLQKKMRCVLFFWVSKFWSTKEKDQQTGNNGNSYDAISKKREV